MKNELLKLDIGSGVSRRDGYITVDKDQSVNPEYIEDALDLSWQDGCVDEIRAFHILEHIRTEDKINVMKEFHRVLKPGGILEIEVPQFPHPASIQDPTHISFWCKESFWYFIIGNKFGENFWARHDGIKTLFEFIEEEDKGWAYYIKLKK